MVLASRLTSEVFTLSSPRGVRRPRKDSRRLALPSREHCPGAAVSRSKLPRRQPPMRFASPSASSRCQAATHPGGYQPPSTCPLSVSHALEALLRPTPAGLVSCRSRPWGFTLQGRSHSQSRVPSRTPHALLRLADLEAAAPVRLQGADTPERVPAPAAGQRDRSSVPPDQPHFRALIPASVRTRRAAV
jgi:hypothetical protein